MMKLVLFYAGLTEEDVAFVQRDIGPYRMKPWLRVIDPTFDFTSPYVLGVHSVEKIDSVVQGNKKLKDLPPIIFDPKKFDIRCQADLAQVAMVEAAQ